MLCFCVRSQCRTGGSVRLQSGPQEVRTTCLWPSLSLKLLFPAVDEYIKFEQLLLHLI